MQHTDEHKSTQLELARMVVESLLHTAISDPLFPMAIRTLRRILDISQNPPPQGRADGSINETTWKLLALFVQTYEITANAGKNAAGNLGLSLDTSKGIALLESLGLL